MEKIYKTIRISRECKYWLNEIIIKKEEELKEKKTQLISIYENQLRNNSDFEGFSPCVSVSVSCGGILEAAFKYTQQDEIQWDKLIEEMNIDKNKIDKNIDVGTLTPRFYLYNDVLDGLELYRSTLKSPEMQRNLMLNYVIKLVIYAYYKKIFKD